MKTTPIYDRAMHEARKHWRDQLDAMSFAGHLALDHPRASDDRRQFAELERSLAPDIHALLQRLSGGNLFLTCTLLLTALEVCCHKYSGDRRVTILTPSTAAGAAATLLPIGGTVDGSAAFKDALLATKGLLAAAFQHQQYPFSRLLLDLPEERRPRYLPLRAALAGFSDDVPAEPCDLAVRFAATAAGLEAAIRFDARVYDETTIRCFFELFEAVLRRGLADPATRIADLPPGPAGAVAVSSETAGGEARELSLHRLIEAQAAERPDGVAVVESGRATTFGALDCAAQRLAGTLAGLGLDQRKPVTLLMDAGTEMIVSMLAALKIGVPFAPLKLLAAGDAPAGSVLEGLDSRCILCRPEHLADLPQLTAGLAGPRPHIVTVESRAPAGGGSAPWFEIAGHPEAEAAPAEEPQPAGRCLDTACVLLAGRGDRRAHTAVTHAELASVFRWLNERGGIGPGDRCLLSPGLDAGAQLYDTLGLLSAGGSVEIPAAADLEAPSALVERLLAPAITVWDLPTALAQNLLGGLLASRAERPHAKGPRNILLSGEKQCAALAEALSQSFPDARITGLSASPAVGIWTTFFALREDPAEPRSGVAAQALPGFAYQVLNPGGEPAPLHATGELTLWRLLAPSQAPLATGLKAEVREGGRVTWLRGDDHRFVKRGCSVELTRVEEALCRHPEVRAAEVVAIAAAAEEGGDRAVVAFLLADPAQLTAEAAAEDLVLHGGVDLVPDRFIPLDEFPLTAEGAIDRAALRARFLCAAGERTGDGRGAALDEIHEQLRRLWREILQVDDVAADESFFSRGGNSLKATLLIVRIHDELGVELSVQKFFKDPSTRAVAQLIAAEAADAAHLKKKGPELKIVPRERYRVQLPELKS